MADARGQSVAIVESSWIRVRLGARSELPFPSWAHAICARAVPVRQAMSKRQGVKRRPAAAEQRPPEKKPNNSAAGGGHADVAADREEAAAGAADDRLSERPRWSGARLGASASAGAQGSGLPGEDGGGAGAQGSGLPGADELTAIVPDECFILTRRSQEPIDAVTVVIWTRDCYAAWKKLLDDLARLRFTVKADQLWDFREAVLQPQAEDADFPRGLFLKPRVLGSKKIATMVNFASTRDHIFQKLADNSEPFPLERCPFPEIKSGHTCTSFSISLKGCHHVVIGHSAAFMRSHPDFLNDWGYLRYAVVPEDFGQQPSYERSAVVPKGPPSTMPAGHAPTVGESQLHLPNRQSPTIGFVNPPTVMIMRNTSFLERRAQLYKKIPPSPSQQGPPGRT